MALRVLHVMGELKLSGAEYMLHSAAKELNSSSSTILSTGIVEGEFASRLRQVGYAVCHQPFSKSLNFFMRFCFFVARGDFDIVHIHTERARFWLILICRLQLKPVVTTVHNEFKFRGLLRVNRRVGRKLGVALGAQFVACSRRVLRNELDQFAIDTLHIPNWCDPRRLSFADDQHKLRFRLERGMASDTFLTISIANDGPLKNLRELFEAVILLDNKCHHFHIGEIGTDIMKEYLAKCAERITFVGAVEDIAQYLSAANVFICSSTFEGGPLVLMEAAMSGVICVSTEVGVAEEFKGQDGFFVTKPDHQSIYRAILKARSLSQNDQKEFAANLRDFAQSKFTPRIGGQKYAELYQKMAVTNKGRTW